MSVIQHGVRFTSGRVFQPAGSSADLAPLDVLAHFLTWPSSELVERVDGGDWTPTSLDVARRAEHERVDAVRP